MAGKKRVEDLREDANLRTVKLHFHRLGKFLRYLKQQDAVIELTFPGENGAGKYKQIYTAGKRDGNPSIEDLVAEALNISGSLAREYTSRKLGIDDKHSDGDKIYATGKVIDAITFYSAASDSIDESTDLLATPNAFRVRTQDPLDIDFSYSKSESDHHSNDEDHPLKTCFRQFSVYAMSNLCKLYRREKALLYSVQHGTPFTPELHQLHSMYGNSLTPDDEASKKLIEDIQNLGIFYYRFIDKEKAEYPILPDYLDFTVPYCSFHARRSAKEKIGDVAAYLQNPDHTLEDFIPYRYEILWALSRAQYPVSEWPIDCQALLLLAYAEHFATEMMMLDCVDVLMKDLKFIIFSSDDQQGLNLQRDSLSLSELSEVLTRYNFKNGLENTIEIAGTNLLKYSILKFPEPHASKGGYSSLAIEELISKALKRYLDKRIRQDLDIMPRAS